MAKRTDIQILVGVQGGGTINSGSGEIIESQIASIMGKINKRNSSKLKPHVDERDLISRITQVVNQINGSGKLKLNFTANSTDLQKSLLTTPFKITIDTTDIQRQIADAIAKMSPSAISLNIPGISGVGGVGDEERAISQIASLKAQINKRGTDLLGLRAGSAEAKELNRQIAELENRIRIIRDEYSRTHNGATLSVTAPYNDPNFIDSSHMRAQAQAAASDHFDQTKSQASAAQVEVQAMIDTLHKLPDATKQTAEWQTVMSQLSTYMVESKNLTQQSNVFNVNTFGQQIADLKALSELLVDVTAKYKNYIATVSAPSPAQPKPAGAGKKTQQEIDLEKLIKLEKEWIAAQTKAANLSARRGREAELVAANKAAENAETARNTERETYRQNYGQTDAEIDAELAKVKELTDAKSRLADATSKADVRLQNEALSWSKITDRVLDYWTNNNKVIAQSPDLYNRLQALSNALLSDNRSDLLKQITDFNNQKLSDDPKSILNYLYEIQRQAIKTGSDTETMGQKITRVFKTKFGYGIMATAAMHARRAIRQLYTNVVELDYAMAQMKIVTGESTKALKEYAEGAADAAKQTGRTITEIMSSSTEYARLGYNLEEALRLSETTAKLSNVADIDTADATSAMTAILKGFRLEAKDAELVGDMMTKVANEYAIDAGELGSALERGGASLAAANNSLAESMALMAAGNAAIQNAETVGTAFKTTSMRIRGTSVEELEEAGLATDGLIESTAKLQSQVKALSGVDIMIDSENYKSTYQIMLEIAQVWDQISDINQAALLEALAGKRNSQVLMSVIQNLDDLTGSYEAAQNAAGTMAKANEIAMDTIQGKTKVLSASWQDLSYNLISSGLVKFIIDLASEIIDGINKINAATGGLIVQFLALAATVSFVIVTFNTLKASALAAGFSSLGSIITSLTTPTGALIVTLSLVGTAIYNIYKAIDTATPSLEDLNKQLSETSKTCEDLQSKLDSNNERLRELNKLGSSMTIVEEDELNKLEQENLLLSNQLLIQEKLQKIQQQDVVDELVNKYGSDAKKTIQEDTSYSQLSPGYADPQFENFNELEHYLWLLEELPKNEEKILQMTRDLASEVPDTFDYKSLENELEGYQVLYEDQLEMANAYHTRFVDEFANIPDDVTGEIAEIRNAINRGNIKLAKETGATPAQTATSLLNTPEFKEAKEVLDKYNKSGELTVSQMSALYKQSEDNSALKNYVDTLVEWSVVSDTGSVSMKKIVEALYGVQSAASGVVNEMSLADLVEDIQGPLATLREAVDDVENAGYVGLDTLKEISSEYPSLEKYLIQTANGYKIAAGAVDEFTESMQSQYKTAITDAKKAAEAIISDHGKIAAAVGLSTEAYISEIKAMIAEKKALIFEADFLGQGVVETEFGTFEEATERAWSHNRTSNIKNWKNEVAEMEAILSDLETSQSNYDKLMSLLNSPSKTSSSESDPLKDSIEKEIKILKHQREMNDITAEQYYDGLRVQMERYYVDTTKYEEEIWALREELYSGYQELLNDWINDQQKAAERLANVGNVEGQIDVYKNIIARIQSELDKAYADGLDANSDFVQDLEEQMRDAAQNILDITKSVFDDFISYADDFNRWDNIGEDFDISKIEMLRAKLKSIQKLLDDGIISWDDYRQAYGEAAKELYDTQKESIETIIDLTMELIEHEAEEEVKALEEQQEEYDKLIEKKKELLQVGKDEADHEKKVAKIVKEIAKLQSDISELALDDSREAASKRAELEEELFEKQNELSDLQSDYALEQTLDALDKAQEAKEEAVDAEIEEIESGVDTWVKKYEQAIDLIDKDWDGLYDRLLDYQEEYRDSIDGIDSFNTAWRNVEDTVTDVNDNIADSIASTIEGIEDIYEAIEELSMSPGMPELDADGNWTGNLIGGNPSPSGSGAGSVGLKPQVNKTGYSLAESMYNNSVDGKKNPSLVGGENGLNAQNRKLADQLEEVLGKELYYNPKSGIWHIGSDHTGIPLYEYFGISEDGYVGNKKINHLRTYHTGGFVDSTGALNDREVLSILEKGELVLNKGHQSNLKSVLSDFYSMVTALTKIRWSSFSMPAVSSGGETSFHTEVNITHSGAMTDDDAKRYGDIAANAALEKFRSAFVKRGVR